MKIKNFWVDIEDASTAKLGAGPLHGLNFDTTSLLDACGEFSFDVSAADPNIAVLNEKRVAICRYVDRDGNTQVFGGGVIDKIVRSVAEDGSLIVHVSGNDLGRELSYRSVGALDLSGVDGEGSLGAPSAVMAFAPPPWDINQEIATHTSVYAAFDGESVLAALTRIGEKIGEHWRIDPGRIVTWLSQAGDFHSSGVRAVQHVFDPVSAETADEIAVIRSLEEESDTADLVTRIYPRGSGNGGVTLTLAAITDSAPAGYTVNATENYVERDDAVAAYGRIERVLPAIPTACRCGNFFNCAGVGGWTNSMARMPASVSCSSASVEPVKSSP